MRCRLAVPLRAVHNLRGKWGGREGRLIFHSFPQRGVGGASEFIRGAPLFWIFGIFLFCAPVFPLVYEHKSFTENTTTWVGISTQANAADSCHNSQALCSIILATRKFDWCALRFPWYEANERCSCSDIEVLSNWGPVTVYMPKLQKQERGSNNCAFVCARDGELF